MDATFLFAGNSCTKIVVCVCVMYGTFHLFCVCGSLMDTLQLCHDMTTLCRVLETDARDPLLRDFSFITSELFISAAPSKFTSCFLFAGFPIYDESYVVEASIKLLVYNIIWFPIHMLWVWFGVSIRKLELPAQTQRKINFVMAGLLLLVAALALWSIN